MKPYIDKLKNHFAEHPPNYGDCDAHTILEMLYSHYVEYNRMDTAEIKKNFETLYHQLTGMPLWELDNIIDTVSTLCWRYEQAGFVEGIKVGLLLSAELTEE